MTLLDLEPSLAQMDIRILATDIDRNVLAQAIAGEYEERQLEDVPDSFLSKYFTSGDGPKVFQVSELVKQVITFRQLNLMDQWPMKGKFDAVLCRNVVIYFSEETQSGLWPRFREKLTPVGLFFLGHSERIQHPSRFGFETIGITSYRRTGATS